MRTNGWCTFAVALYAATAPAGTSYLTFSRIVPAAIDLGKVERMAVIYAIGDTGNVDTFVERFIQYADKNGTLQIENAVEGNRNFRPLDDSALRRLRRLHPADAYIGINQFTCSGTERSAEGSERDASGERVRRRHLWVDATCQVRIEVRRADGRSRISFGARGDGTSPRVASLTEEERAIAFEQAARYTALSAAEMITPRVERESIELDETAPQFDEGMAMINSEQLSDARAIWEAALRQHRDSAALHYDLGAVCEAMGDLGAAAQHFQRAVRLAPGDLRYRRELDLLERKTPAPAPR